MPPREEALSAVRERSPPRAGSPERERERRGALARAGARLGRRERARVQAAKARARLARVGVLAGGLAEEMRGPLQEIRDDLTQLRERLEEETAFLAPWVPSVELCDEALGATSRLELLVRDFLAHARPEPGPPRIVDVSALLREWVRALEPELAARDLAIVAEVRGALCAIADPAGLKQIFWHLVRNARDA